MVTFWKEAQQIVNYLHSTFGSKQRFLAVGVSGTADKKKKNYYVLSKTEKCM